VASAPCAPRTTQQPNEPIAGIRAARAGTRLPRAAAAIDFASRHARDADLRPLGTPHGAISVPNGSWRADKRLPLTNHLGVSVPACWQEARTHNSNGNFGQKSHAPGTPPISNFRARRRCFTSRAAVNAAFKSRASRKYVKAEDFPASWILEDAASVAARGAVACVSGDRINHEFLALALGPVVELTASAHAELRH
jgi:hypothetical protein